MTSYDVGDLLDYTVDSYDENGDVVSKTIKATIVADNTTEDTYTLSLTSFGITKDVKKGDLD